MSCERCARVLHTGEGRVLVALTVDELVGLAWDSFSGWHDSPVVEPLLRAAALLDPDKAAATRAEMEQCRG